MKEDGGPAYPVIDRSGMSLRDYFAGQALAGFLADPKIIDRESSSTISETYSRQAYIYADAMLAERKQA
jgi:hypothetical protein